MPGDYEAANLFIVLEEIAVNSFEVIRQHSQLERSNWIINSLLDRSNGFSSSPSQRLCEFCEKHD